MRVLYVMNSFNYGGAEKLVMALSTAIIDRCDFVGIAALYRNGDALEEKLCQQLEEKGIRTYILDKRAGKDRLAAVRKVIQILRTEKVRLIHGHCSVPMLIAKLSGFLTGIPVVSTIHNTRGYSVRREKLTGWMSRSYVSIGEAAERYMLEELKIPPKKITRIVNAVDTSLFFPEVKTENFWSKWDLCPQLPVVLNVGRVVKQKNQMCLLQALRLCRDAGKPVQCAILGDYEESSPVYKEIHEYIEDNHLGSLVKFLGRHSDVRSFLNNADAFVMTSFYEGLSVSFLEALFCRTPIVVTQMPFVEELQKIGHCATVIPQDDPASLCQVLMEGADYLPDLKTLEAFRTQFSLDTFAEKHLSLYDYLLGEKLKES